MVPFKSGDKKETIRRYEVQKLTEKATANDRCAAQVSPGPSVSDSAPMS
jgi:hypothetical protein